MRKSIIVIGLLVVATGYVLFGFNVPKSQACGTKKAVEKEDPNTSFALFIGQQIKFDQAKEEAFQFSIYGYNEATIDTNEVSDRNGDIIQNFPARWIDDVNKERNASWAKVYRRSITQEKLLAAKKIDDLIRDYPSQWLKRYEYVSVNIHTKLANENISFMNKSNDLSSDQLRLLHRGAIGTKFDIVINYKTVHFVSLEEEFERMSLELTLVPEKEAEFPNGYGQLIAYFQENMQEMKTENALQDFSFLKMKFTIGTDGRAEAIESSRASGNPVVDGHIFDLIQHMPKWTPAQDKKGNPVKQPFELVYASTMGC